MAREMVVINGSPDAAGAARFPVGVADIEMAVAMGYMSPFELVQKTGYMIDYDIVDSPEDLTNTKANYLGMPAAEDTLEILSTSADDAAAGTGARTVKISGLLDADYEAVADVTVTLDGTTEVSLGTAEYLRGSKIEVVTAGSGGENAGVLTLRQVDTTTNILAEAEIGDNQSFVCAGTVPAGKTLFITGGYVSCAITVGGAQSGIASVRVRDSAADSGFVAVRKANFTHLDPWDIGKGGVIVITEKQDYKITIDALTADDGMVSGALHGYMRED